MQTHDFMRRRFLLAIFVVSGFTGLIYESIWSHYLKLFLGHAAYAQTLMLAIFMGGMALGSRTVAHYSYGRPDSRDRNSRSAYASVQTGADNSAILGILGL
jgi:spermidine synthase